MATQPPIKPDTIEPLSPQEAPGNPNPVETPQPIDPDTTPPDSFPGGGGDTIEPGHGPEEMPAR